MAVMFRALSVPRYRTFITGALAGHTGIWIQRVAQDWLVLQLTGSGAAVGFTVGLQFLPGLLFGLHGGALVDRVAKRRLLVFTQWGLAVQALVTGVLVVAGVARPWQVYLLAVLGGVVTSLEFTGRNALVAEVVPPGLVPNAVALHSATANVARLVGPAVAGGLIAWRGVGWVFLLNTLFFALSVLGLIRMRGHHPDVPSRGGDQARSVRAAMRYVGSRPELVLVLVMVFLISTFGYAFEVSLVLFATQAFHRDATAYGVLSSVCAAGTLAGALLGARRGSATPRQAVGAAAGFGMVALIAAAMPTYWAFAAILVPLGAAALLFNTASNAIVQVGVSDQMRGRATAMYVLVASGGTPIGAPAIGAVSETFGPRWSLIGGGLVALASAGGGALFLAHRARRQRLHPAPAEG